VEIPILVLEEDMLIMVIVLMIQLLIGGRHGLDNGGRIMPNETLKELVTPPDAYLISPVNMVPFILRKRRQSHAAEDPNDANSPFHAAKIQKNIGMCKFYLHISKKSSTFAADFEGAIVFPPL
jgi:hypothetical protein